MTHVVPLSVQRTAARALELHREAPLDDVAGVKVADTLASGSVPSEVVAKLHRFFETNALAYRNELQLMRSESDSALVRSWLLHGAEAGQRWAETELRRARVEGFDAEDPTVGLLRLHPDEVYDRFSLGAWRFEYALDPRKAARFVEEYHRATGWNLDLRRAFGESAGVVGHALARRFSPVNPFREAAKALKVRDSEYRLAAEVDLAELTSSLGRDRGIEEALKKPVFETLPPLSAAKMVWPAFVAYAILAVEQPDLLTSLNASSKRPPSLTQSTLVWSQYHDAFNTYITYFHPQGARFIDPSKDKSFADLPAEMEDFVLRAFFGKKLQPVAVQRLLGKARRWTAQNKLAGSLFHIYNADWKKGNWQHILDAIPEDADVRPYFAEFVKQGALPSTGVKLQQTLADKKMKDAVATYLTNQGYKVGSGVDLKPVPIGTTEAGKAAESMGTPLGVYSVVKQGTASKFCLGAYVTHAGAMHVFSYQDGTPSGKFDLRPDWSFRQVILSGEATVVAAHKDMPGTAYTHVQPKAPAPATAQSDAAKQDPVTPEPVAKTPVKKEAPPVANTTLLTGFLDGYEEIALDAAAKLAKAWNDELQSADISETEFAARFKALYFSKLELGEVFVHTASGFEERLIGAVRGPGVDALAILFHQDSTGFVRLDEQSVMMLGNKGLVPKWAWNPATGKPLVQQAPTEPEPVASPVAHGFAVNDIIALNGWKYVVLAAEQGAYVLQLLQLQPGGFGHAAKTYKASAVDADASLVVSGVSSLLGRWSHFNTTKYKPYDFPSNWQVWQGATLNQSDSWVVLGGLVEDGNEDNPYLALGKFTPSSGMEIKLVLASAVLGKTVVATYAPPELVPDSSHEDDEPDPESGSFEMAGTQEAFDFLAKRGWVPATKSEHSTFLLGLGEKLSYVGAATRLILGYGFTNTGNPVYVIRTEKGNLNWVSTVNAHKKYGHALKIESLTLLPKPGEASKVKYSKLPYRLSKLAKAVAEEHGVVYVPGPRKPAQHVGVQLQGADVFVIVGWRQMSVSDEPRAVAGRWIEGGKTEFYMLAADALAFLPIHYATKTGWEPGMLGFDVGKGDDLSLSVEGPELSLPSEGPDDWDDPEPVKQPPLPTLSEGKHVAAGVVALIPPGTSVNVGGSISQLVFPAVVLYRPIGMFGGYKLNLPKGTVSKGESIVRAAVREVKEETGLTVRPVQFLGDFRGNTSMTRMFIGNVTGGNPKKKTQPEESEAVIFRVLDSDAQGKPLYRKAKWYRDLLPVSENKWQQHAVDAAFEWYVKHGSPHYAKVDQDGYHAAVTGPDDTAAEIGGVPVMTPEMIAGTVADALGVKLEPEQALFVTPSDTAFKPTITADKYEGDVWKTLYFKCPFPVTNGLVNQLKGQVAAGVAAMPVSYDLARDRENGPKYGQSFETKGGTPYVAAGYVSWLGVDGKPYHFLLCWTPGGAAEAIPCAADGLPGAQISHDQHLFNAALDPFYQHQDPDINALIVQVYETGELPPGVPIQDFKVKWCKDAGVPAYAVITKPLLRDVASMFVAGACSQAQHDAIIGGLKARMKQTHKKGVQPATAKTGGAVAAPPAPVPSSSGAAYVAAPPLKAPPPASFESPVYTQYVLKPQPFLFQDTGGGISGGSKPNTLLQGPGGRLWFAKWSPGEDWRADVDHAAYRLSALCKSNNVPVGVMELGVKGSLRRVSFQPFIEDAHTPIADPSALSDSNITELLAQHAVDMFMGDHDGHAGNWLMSNGRLVAVDRGQAFKFLLQGGEESLDPKWHAPGNFGQGYAKKLLIQWGAGTAEISQAAFAEMYRVIQKVEAITDEQLDAILQPVAAGLKLSPLPAANFKKRVRQRRDSYAKDWTKVLKGLRSDFQWPAVAAVAAPPALVSSPKDLGFGLREEKYIADAIKAGWQGKALRVGGTAIENQEVMVRRVMWSEKAGVSVPATLIHFRVARPAGLKAAKHIAKSHVVENGDALGGPHRLVADKLNSFWEKIVAAVKTVNHHLGVQKDLEINMNTIGAMKAIEPLLNQIIQETEDSSGTYAPTKEPNEAVYAMAEQYLQYVGIINYWVAHKEEMLGQKTPQLSDFLWEDPPTDAPKQTAAYKVVLKKQGALWPTANPVGQEVHVTNLNKPVMNSSHQSQFVIEDPKTKARVFFNPPGGVQVQGLQEGVETLKGQAWAIVPGEPSPATVAHLLKMFQEATGLPMRAATPEDDEALYWSRQAAVLQNSGQVQPNPDHTIVVDPEYAQALALYDKGDAQGAISKLKGFVASRVGQSVSALSKIVTPAEIEGHYTRGAGFFRHHRIGWDRERLAKLMGPTVHVAHHLADDMVTWMQQVASNGALLSNALKPYYGVTKTGASPGADMNHGGGQAIFCCFRKDFSTAAGMVYFDISLALRLDVYIVGTGDTFGDTKIKRFMTPESWVAVGAHKGVGYTGSSSPLQVNVRHDIDLRQYLVRAVCGTEAARKKAIQIANQLGWTFYGGRKPEDVFVS